MKSLSASQVAKPLYGFAQMAFTGAFDPRAAALDSNAADLVLRRITSGQPLSIKEAMALPIDERRALSELLTQYVMFLTMFSDLTFPPDFLDGTDETCIGSALLAYVAKHQWPFPRLLPWSANA